MPRMTGALPTLNAPSTAPSQSRSLVTLLVPSFVIQRFAPSKAMNCGCDPTAATHTRPTPIAACFDLVDSLHFLWSVAQARAVQEQTKMIWQPYRDSTILNAIYAV